MLLAEIHGKYDLAVRGHEDYLTSTVFSHLRYVHPGAFWSAFFSRARTLPVQGNQESLTAVLGEEHQITNYEKLQVIFWPKCAGLGEPELAMCFTGVGQIPLVVLVEVKLWSNKSGYGEHDQLMRYLQIADSISQLVPAVPPNPRVVVVYLTPREALLEVRDSLTQYGDSDENRRRIFRLQWQDMIEAITESLAEESAFSRLILDDVRSFLRVRRLEYFRGFSLTTGIGTLQNGCGSFFVGAKMFHGFQVGDNLAQLQVIRGAWSIGN